MRIANRLTGSIFALGMLSFKNALNTLWEYEIWTFAHLTRCNPNVATTQLPSYELNEASRPNLPPEKLRNLRLVFLGDSLTRYQYLSLAYFLRHGRWFDPNISINNLVDAHSFHHPLHPDEDWNEFFWQSNRMLHPMEVCDCLRSQNGEILVERRYFYDSIHNNMAVYINMNGNKTNSGRGYYGRLQPRDIFGPNFKNMVGLPFGMSVNTADAGSRASSIQWEYATWGEVIRNHVGVLNLNYNATDATASDAAAPRRRQPSNAHVILNAGLHPHDFLNPMAAQGVHDALEEIHLPGTWKTTTFVKDFVLEHQKSSKLSNGSGLHDGIVSARAKSTAGAAEQTPPNRESDTGMCHALGRCFNLTWTALLKPSLYFDNLHFLEPVYRILNEDLLEQLGQLPSGYVKLNRETVMVENALMTG